jgi:hypothetical protein
MQIPGVRDKINVFHFERTTLERAGIMDHGTPTPPFLVVASNEINEDLNLGACILLYCDIVIGKAMSPSLIDL